MLYMDELLNEIRDIKQTIKQNLTLLKEGPETKEKADALMRRIDDDFAKSNELIKRAKAKMTETDTILMNRLKEDPELIAAVNSDPKLKARVDEFMRTTAVDASEV